MKKSLICICFILFCMSCENRDLNAGEEFRPMEMHDSFQGSHFAKVEVDGVEYLLMERDNNNPHEGFGFMAFRGNNLIEKQDTALAYLRAIYELQTRMYANSLGQDITQVRNETDSIFESFLLEEASDLIRLEQDSLESKQLSK